MKCLLIISLLIISIKSLPDFRKNNHELIINGELNNINGTIQYIYILTLKMNDNNIDSIKVVGNKYAYKTNLIGATLVTLFAGNPNNPDVRSDKNMIALFLEAGNVNISSTDSFSNAKVSGSNAFEEFQNFNKSIGIGTTKGVCLAPPDDSVYANCFNKNPSSMLAPYILCKHATGYSNTNMIKLIEPLYNELTVEGKSSYFGQRVKMMIDKAKSGL